MAVIEYFGLPGCGKTTLLTSNVRKHVRSKQYQNVYGNVHLAVPGYTYIDNDCIGKYMLINAAIHIDEATLFADSRDYKNFTKALIQFFLLHRHYNVDIYLYTQDAVGVDKKIRVITDRVYFVYKPAILGRWFTKYYRIPYGIIIPDPKKEGAGEKLGDIVQGYCKPSFLVRLFSPWVFRPTLYKYFDSWECPELPSLPDQYIAYA